MDDTQRIIGAVTLIFFLGIVASVIAIAERIVGRTEESKQGQCDEK